MVKAMTKNIDSLPATPETVGMPQIGDIILCHGCEQKSIVWHIHRHGVVGCPWCGSYDVEKVKP